ncbi:MAG: nitronate monooxygenase [Firmicutes bacterium HGW-Firmicutes-15]|nr:MAG: nitronate monooxygenase [Firmicutes bacterium HGW-Firmicutes-15]
MSIRPLKELQIGDLIARIPIVQGGMGVGVSMAGLASAVANEGGIGVIAAAGIGMLEPDGYTNFLEACKRRLRAEIREARQATSGILGVNIMVALSNFADMVTTSIEEGIDIIFSGAGLPLTLPKFLDGNHKTKLVPIVSSGRAAALISKRWLNNYNYLPDAIVVEGPMAGGHLGFKAEEISNPGYSLEMLVPEVIKEMKPFVDKKQKAIPVIAGGGIYNGEDIYKFIELGADGVQMATRFVTTHECDASIKFKQAYLDSSVDDVLIIKSPVGMPGRALRNEFIDDVLAGKKTPFKCPYHCIVTCDYQNSPYCIAIALMNAQRGNMKHGLAFAGENVHRCEEITSVKELMDSLVKEYQEAAQNA